MAQVAAPPQPPRPTAKLDRAAMQPRPWSLSTERARSSSRSAGSVSRSQHALSPPPVRLRPQQRSRQPAEPREGKVLSLAISPCACRPHRKLLRTQQPPRPHIASARPCRLPQALHTAMTGP